MFVQEYGVCFCILSKKKQCFLEIQETCFLGVLFKTLIIFFLICYKLTWLLYSIFSSGHNHLVSSSWIDLMILARYCVLVLFLSPHWFFFLCAISTGPFHTFNFIFLAFDLYFIIGLDVHLYEDCHWHTKYYTQKKFKKFLMGPL